MPGKSAAVGRKEMTSVVKFAGVAAGGIGHSGPGGRCVERIPIETSFAVARRAEDSLLTAGLGRGDCDAISQILGSQDFGGAGIGYAVQASKRSADLIRRDLDRRLISGAYRQLLTKVRHR